MPNFDKTYSRAGNTLRVVITTSNDYSSANVKTFGKRKVGYDDSSELVFFPSNFTMTFHDPTRALYDGVRVNDELVDIYKNGSLYYSGKIDVRQSKYDDKGKECTFTVIDGANILKTIKIKDNGDANLNPLGYTNGTGKKVQDIILDVFKQVNSSVALTVNQDWSFKQLSAYGTNTYTFSQLYFPVSQYFFTYKPFTTLAELLKNYAQAFGCTAGMMDRNNAYFVKRWKSSISPTALGGSVKSFRRVNFLNKLDGVRVIQNQPAPPGFDKIKDEGTVDVEGSGEFKNPDKVLQIDMWVGATDDENSSNIATTSDLNQTTAVGTVRDTAIDSTYRDMRVTIGKYHYNYRQSYRDKYEATLRGTGWSMTTLYSYSGKTLRPSQIEEDVETNESKMIAIDIT